MTVELLSSELERVEHHDVAAGGPQRAHRV